MNEFDVVRLGQCPQLSEKMLYCTAGQYLSTSGEVKVNVILFAVTSDMLMFSGEGTLSIVKNNNSTES